jgi:DNA adenine methylase
VSVSAAQQSLPISSTATPSFCSPILKFLGSKRWLVKLAAIRLHAHLTKVDGIYVEPFAGSLALGLGIGWPASVYSDTLHDLVNLYSALATDAEEVARLLDFTRTFSGEKDYYNVRKSIWPENRGDFTSAGLAARTIWLNKNCVNGLMRHNKKGQFNASWGKRENVALPSRAHLESVGQILKSASIRAADFETVLNDVEKQYEEKYFYSASRLVVYIDPPYAARLKNVTPRGPEARPGKDMGVFTGYSATFSWADQVRLAKKAKYLANRGALVIASNAWTDEVCDLYRDGFALFQVTVRHCVGMTEDRRGQRAEMIAISLGHEDVLESVPAGVVTRKG